MRPKPDLKLLAVLLAISLLFTHCKKGDTGPTGPAGNTGATGAAGPQGPKGDTGTANVIYSGWLDVSYKPDTLHIGTAIDTIGYYSDIPAAKLSSAIISGGEMKVYINIGTAISPDVFPLPYFNVYSGLNIGPEYFLQRIHLYSNANASTYSQNGSKLLQYRYVLIPGNIGGRVAQTIDWNDYKKVKVYLGLKD
ncbi:MAG: hypothetical protein JWQ09_5003 [Segetibacter sp.]|nr:hypothetical protein [Segetibacter sp.]